MMPLEKKMNKPLIIRGELPNLNGVIDASKRHWAQYSKVKKKWTETVATEAVVQRMQKVKNPVWVETKFYRKTKRGDPDNIRIAVKYILDGLVLIGVLPDDNQQWVRGFTDTFLVDKDDPRIEVILREQTDEQ
jgi:Holliday junction resolvase RusA-like endonuclease